MKQLIMQYMVMVIAMVVVGVVQDTTKVRLYYKWTPSSKLSIKRVTPLVWHTTPTGASMYVDIPRTLLADMECTHGYSTAYKLKGKANRYAKRACKVVL